MTSRELKNLGVNLTGDKEESRGKKLRTRQLDHSKANMGKDQQQVDAENPQGEAKVSVPPPEQGDPNLQGLSPTKLAYISSLVQAQMMKVASSMRVVPLNPAINIPIYDENNMTSDTFFKQCELYLKSQGFQKPQFHEMVRVILASDPSKKLWYDNVAIAITSWEEFRVSFKEKYDSPLIQERRKDRLRRRQHINEPVENYVYEIVNLSRQISPDEEEKISVLRAKRGMIPELSLFIGDCSTVNELLEKASIAIETIRARDRMTQRHTRLPPFSTRYENRGSSMQQSNFGRGQGRNYGNFSQQSSSNRFQRNNESQQHNYNEYQNPNSQFRPRLGSAPPRFSSRNNSNVVCHSCNEQGHIARFCTNRQSSVSSGQNPGTSGTQVTRYFPPQNQGHNTNNSQRLPGNLNSLGR